MPWLEEICIINPPGHLPIERPGESAKQGCEQDRLPALSTTCETDSLAQERLRLGHSNGAPREQRDAFAYEDIIKGSSISGGR